MSYFGRDTNEPHALEVLRWNETTRTHECHIVGDKSTRFVLVDLFVDGKFPDLEYADLIGKIVSVDYVHGFIWIASNPRISGQISEEGEGPTLNHNQQGTGP
jgi:hypothetical protein